MLAYIAPANAAATTSYVYDSLGRVIEVTVLRSDGGHTQTTYAYDAANNRTSKTVTVIATSQQRVAVVPLLGYTVIPLNSQ